MVGFTAMCGLGGYFLMRKAKQSGLDSGALTKTPAYATAKMMVTMNPELEIVSSDDSSGTIVVREKKTGKTMTFKFDPDKKSMVVVDEDGKEATVKTEHRRRQERHRSAILRRHREVRRLGEQSDARLDTHLSRLLAERNFLFADARTATRAPSRSRPMTLPPR